MEVKEEQAEAKVEVNAAEKLEEKVEAKVEEKTDAKPDTKPEAKLEAKPDAPSDSKPTLSQEVSKKPQMVQQLEETDMMTLYENFITRKDGLNHLLLTDVNSLME